MNLAREGLVFIGVAVLVATVAFGLALGRRSWPLWLLAFVLLLAAIWVSYFFHRPVSAT